MAGEVMALTGAKRLGSGACWAGECTTTAANNPAVQRTRAPGIFRAELHTILYAIVRL